MGTLLKVFTDPIHDASPVGMKCSHMLLSLPKELRLGMVRDEQRLRLSSETLRYCRARLEQILNATINGGFAANVTRWRNNRPKKTRLLRQKNLEKGVRAAMLMMVAPMQTHMHLQLIAARWNTHQALKILDREFRCRY